MADQRSLTLPPLDERIRQRYDEMARWRYGHSRYARSTTVVAKLHPQAPRQLEAPRPEPQQLEEQPTDLPEFERRWPERDIQPNPENYLPKETGRSIEQRNDQRSRRSLEPTPPVVEGDWTNAADKRVGTNRLIAGGFLVIFMFFGAGVLWAGLAPLSSAAIAPGLVSVAGNRKTVQHFEGGIVNEILVQEGEAVTAGQPLIRLDDTQSRTSLELLRKQQVTALAQEARLRTEMADEYRITFPPELEAQRQDPTIEQILQSQEDVFGSRRMALENQTDILQQRMVQQELEITGLENQIASSQKQLGLIEQELETVQTLVEKGLATRTRLFGLQREQTDLEGNIVQLETQIAVTQGAIQEVKSQIADLYAARYEQTTVEVREVRDSLIELKERLPAVEDAFRRTTITAPISGRVVNLQVHTVGGVIASGTPVLDIVPDNDELVIEAHLDPKDRDVVTSGMPAEIRFTAFNQRNSVPVKGRVVWISADGLADERTGSSYYTARIELIEDPTKALNGASIYPGMLANVMIVTGERTALSYLFKPITSSFTKAFREE